MVNQSLVICHKFRSLNKFNMNIIVILFQMAYICISLKVLGIDRNQIK